MTDYTVFCRLPGDVGDDVTCMYSETAEDYRDAIRKAHARCVEEAGFTEDPTCVMVTGFIRWTNRFVHWNDNGIDAEAGEG